MNRARPILLAGIWLLLITAPALPTGASAQPASPALAGDSRQEAALDPPGTFGTATEIAHVVPASEFTPVNTTDSWSYVSIVDPTTGVIRREANGFLIWFAGLHLPAGAVVTRLEMSGCDSIASAELRFALYRATVPPGTGFAPVTPDGATGVTATPGCDRFSVTPSSPLVIDSADATYWVRLETGTSIAFESVRVFYRLQVSAAPATATFGDVPASHPFFQYVEALVASGITAGCGGGNYCPEAPLTRGQMAVFLSKALGLHFAP